MNVMGQKEQRVEGDLESCGQGNILALDVTDEVFDFAPWEASGETAGPRMEKRPKFLHAPPSGMLKIALQAWLSPLLMTGTQAPLFLGTPASCFTSKFHCTLIFLLRSSCTT